MRKICLPFVLGVVGWLGLDAARAEPVLADWVVEGGQLVDGTGASARRADVAIRGDQIVAVGTFEIDPRARRIGASGRIVAPGFIDLHTHSDQTILHPQARANRNYLAQGVTTIITGNCGSGLIDVGAYLARLDHDRQGTNVLHLIPHGAVRRAVMGSVDRPAGASELRRMEAIVERGMETGAWGMSTGLVYVPGCLANTEELITLSRIVARHGGIYASHIRDEGSGLLDAIAEAIRIGREVGLPVHISHLKAIGQGNWGKVEPACEALAAARAEGLRVTADQYPYNAMGTYLAAMVVPEWARIGSTADFQRLSLDPVQGDHLRQAIAANLAEQENGANIRIARYKARPDRVGRDLASIARAEGITPVELVLDIERHGGASAISFGMSEDDIRFVMRRDWVATASDGSAHAAGANDRPHPRAYGTFPRKIRYALDEHVLSLERAVHSCTGLPAEIVGLSDRGTVRTGAKADLVIFDPTAFRDLATYDEPAQLAKGVDYLFVNGTAEIARGRFTGALAGRALRHQSRVPKPTGPH